MSAAPAGTQLAVLEELSGSCVSTHLRVGRISELSPGSCFPNWLQGKPRMTRPNGCSSSCSAFSSGPGREQRPGHLVRSPASSHQRLLAGHTAEITEAQQWGLAQDRWANVSVLGVKSHPPDSAGCVAGLGGKQVTPFLRSVFSPWPTSSFLQDWISWNKNYPLLGEGRGLPRGEVGPLQAAYTLGTRDPREALAQLPLPTACTRSCSTLLHKRTTLFQGLTEAF